MKDDWITVLNHKKIKREHKKKKQETENQMWEKLRELHPHIIFPKEALEIQQKLNIRNLYNKLTSEEWINYQCNGWRYEKLIKSGNFKEIPFDTDKFIYSTLPVENKWRDIVLFSLNQKTPSV